LVYQPVKPVDSEKFDSFETEEFLFRQKFFELYGSTTSNLKTVSEGTRESYRSLIGEVDGLCLFVWPRTSQKFKAGIEAIDVELEKATDYLDKGYNKKTEVYKLLKKKVKAVSNDYYTILSRKPLFGLGGSNAKTK
jgi:hypothetical protein